ncbi:hypothetical protein QYE76_066822 [Lolium multiflorum]|uniref:Retrotransposon gag domain-containing protein n=1 Tax=Lolium multiflorum TaxID=4521 RepID=A0AAD8SDH5_LOLMU|nr:hypothetical protein QYE76_066822 [Lolium multiflorum]
MQQSKADTSRRLESNPEHCISTAQKDAIASQHRDGESRTGSTERRRKVRDHPNPIPVPSDSTPKNPAKGKDPMYTGRQVPCSITTTPSIASPATPSPSVLPETPGPMGQVESTSATTCRLLGTGAGSVRRSHARAGTKTASLSLVGIKNASRNLEGADTKSAHLSLAGAGMTEAITTKRKGATEAGASRGSSDESPKAEEHPTGPLADPPRHHPGEAEAEAEGSRSCSKSPGGGPRDARERLNEYRSDYIGPSDLEENTIFCWLDLKKAFENHFRGTYKRPATTSDLQACIQKKGETSRSFLNRWLATRNECENVDNRTAMHAFIGGLQRGGLLRHKLTCLVNANKLTLDEMINIASDHTAADDDAGGDLAATAIPLHQQKKNQAEEAADVEVEQASSAPTRSPQPDPAPPNVRRIQGYAVPGSSDPATGKSTHTNRNCKWVNDLKNDPEAGYKRARKHRPRGKGGKGKNKDKEEDSSEAMDEDDASPKPKEGTAANKSNPFGKKSVGTYHTFLGTPTVRAKKSALRLLNATVPAVPQYVKWSEKACTFDRSDHPAVIPKECYALVVSPRIDGYDFSKCLMDGGASLNIMYLETLEKMNLTKDQLKHSTTEFHGVVPGKKANFLGSIKLPVAFGDVNNYREEMITFEVVPFKSSYHVIFGRPTYHKFHARACYIYNKLKIPGPYGMITVSGDYKKARDCEEGEAAFAESVISGEELQGYRAAVDPTEMQITKKQISEQKTSFKAAIETKKHDLVEGDDSKQVSVGANMDPK